MFDAARVGVPLIQEIVETPGEIDLFRNFAAENSKVHKEESAQFRLRDGSCPARILGIDAGKSFFCKRGTLRFALANCRGELGKSSPRKHVASVL